jgi:hypothetical protein
MELHQETEGMQSSASLLFGLNAVQCYEPPRLTILPPFYTHTIDFSTTHSQTRVQKPASLNRKISLEHLNQDTCYTNLAIESALH